MIGGAGIRRIAPLLACTITLGCAPADEAGEPSSFSVGDGNDLPAVGSPEWTNVEPEDEVVARVAGVPITSRMVKMVGEVSQVSSPREALERLIELEVLAQHAVARGLTQRPAVTRVRKESLVQRFLVEGFEADFGMEALPLEQVKTVYSIPSVRELYDHADAWRIVHVLFTCCNAVSESCDTPDVLACYEDTGVIIQDVYRELKPIVAGLEPDTEAVKAVMQSYTADNRERFAPYAIGVQEYSFYYDPAKSHEEQKGYDLTAEAVAVATIKAKIGFLQRPVRTGFGWHVILKMAHKPEMRLGPDDPYVISDIRKNLLPQLRAARLQELLELRMESAGVEIDGGPLTYLSEARGASQ